MIFTDNYYNIMSAQIKATNDNNYYDTVQFTLLYPAKTTSGAEQTILYSGYVGSSSYAHWYGLTIFALLMLRNIGKNYFYYSDGTEPLLPSVWNGTTTSRPGLRYSVEQTSGIDRTDYTMDNTLKNYCTLTNVGNQSWQLTVYNSSSSAISFNTFKIGIQMQTGFMGSTTYLYLIAEHDLGANTLQPGESITFNIRRPYANEVT